MRVLIVGGAGFIGTALAASLHRVGIEACILDAQRRLDRIATLVPDVPRVTYDYVDADATKLLASLGGSVLVHLGCSTTPARSMQSLQFDAETNIVSSLRLFDAAQASGIRKIIYASSGGTVYGVPQRLPVSETDPARPMSAYGVSKLAMEHYLGLYDVVGISLRIANPYGSYQLKGVPVGVIARYMEALRRGESIEVWGDGTVIRDYIAIEDLVEAMLRSIVDPVEKGAYNVGSGIGVSINDLIGVLSEVTGRSVDVRYLEGRGYDVPAIVLDTAKIRGMIDWAPKVSLRDGVKALWNDSNASL